MYYYQIMLKLRPYQTHKEILYNLLMIIKDLNIIMPIIIILIMPIKVLYLNSDTELIISKQLFMILILKLNMIIMVKNIKIMNKSK